MAATTDQKARLFDLMMGVGELVRDGNRDARDVAEVLQIIKNEQDFAALLLAKKDSVLVPEPPRPMLLEAIGSCVIPATHERFIAAEKFVVNTSRKVRVKISYIGDNFRSWFLDKVEDPVAEETLRYARLLRSVQDAEIRAEIGQELEEVMLAQIYVLMERQPNGQKGILLTDWWNVFYARDALGLLRAVRVFWHDDGWHVSAHSVEHPYGWDKDDRVFSRNSSVLVSF